MRGRNERANQRWWASAAPSLLHIAAAVLIVSLWRLYVTERKRREAMAEQFAKLSAWTWAQAVKAEHGRQDA